MTTPQLLQTRQADDEAQKLIQASLYCDRRGSRWNVAAVVVAILAPISQALLKEDTPLNMLVQYLIAAAIAVLLHKYSQWKERGRVLRNEFEYRIYDIAKPYPSEIGPEDVATWQQRYVPAGGKQDTKKWFAECEPPDDYLHQVRAAQLESLRFGALTRWLWAITIGLVCLAVLAVYLRLEAGQIFRSTGVTLTTVAVIAIVSQIGRVAVQSFTHARARSRLSGEIRAYDPAVDASTGSTQSLAIFQERINALRANRVIVPVFIYQIVSWRTSKRRKPQS